MAPRDEAEDVLGFWFPTPLGGDRDAVARRIEWWFRGGADPEIVARFSPLLARATAGDLDGWAATARGRLALILVLDQFPRSIHRGTAQAFALGPKAVALALEGIACGHYDALATPWEKTFFFLPLGHSEDLAMVERAVAHADALVADGPADVRWWLDFSANQARGTRDVIARFGRHPHRNEALGRRSTPEELEFLASGQLVHTRPLPR
jgi:uncharacterized protein (DUF924 family)